MFCTGIEWESCNYFCSNRQRQPQAIIQHAATNFRLCITGTASTQASRREENKEDEDFGEEKVEGTIV